MLVINNKTKVALLGLLVATGMAACSSVTDSIETKISLSESPLYGKFVWHDLVTTDIRSARTFYAELFGWRYVDTDRPDGSGPYTLIKSGNLYVGGMVNLDTVDKDVVESRWIGYMSVADVDQAVTETAEAGGKALISPRDIGTVGRAAIIEDPQGAVLGIARIKLGDPDDSNSPESGHIAWNELLALEPDPAARFYSGLAGLEVQTISRRGGEYIKMSGAGQERAGILANPIEGVPATWLTYFAVDDPVTAAAAVESAGGKVLIPPANEFREGTVALAQDPTGAILMLQKWPM